MTRWKQLCLGVLVEQTNVQAPAKVDRGEDVFDDLQLLRVERRHDVSQVDAPDLQQHLVVHDLLQQLQILHREEHICTSHSLATRTLEVQVLDVVHVVVQDRREDHLQLLVAQLRLCTSPFSPAPTHEAQHLDVPHVAALQERLQHLAVHAREVHLCPSRPSPTPTTQTQRVDVGAVRRDERLHEQLHRLRQDRAAYASHAPEARTHANAQQLRLISLQILDQLQEVRKRSLSHVVAVDVPVVLVADPRHQLRLPRRLRLVRVLGGLGDGVPPREVHVLVVLLPVDVLVVQRRVRRAQLVERLPLCLLQQLLRRAPLHRRLVAHLVASDASSGRSALLWSG